MSGSNGFYLQGHSIPYFTDALGNYLHIENIDSLTLLFVL